MAATDQTPADENEFTILVPTTDLRSAGRLIQLAAALMPVHEGEARGKVLPLGVVEIPEELGFSSGAVPARMHRQMLGRLGRMNKSPRVELRTLVRVHRQVWHGIVEAAREEGANLILLGWSGRVDADSVLGTTIDEAVRNAPCDIAVAKGVNVASAKRILVPIRGGPHAALAFKLATGLADRVDGTVTALRIERPARRDARRRRHDRQPRARPRGVRGRPGHRPPTGSHPSGRRPGRLGRRRHPQPGRAPAGRRDGRGGRSPGPRPDLRPDRRGACPPTRQGPRGGEDAPPGHRHPRRVGASLRPAADSHPPSDISQIVDKWFAENTFDSREFERIDELVRLKRQQGLTISLGLPALNEEETIGTIIKSVRQELMERHALLDEIVLIDSRSTDRTREICADLGIPVYIHQDILPEHGSYHGKGEALWKSLHVLKGDIIAWIDTDIRNIHPRFVYGLIGPLLKDERIQFVKGFYKRPIRGPGGVLQSNGGGRVTELTARPLFNLFYPELSGLIQPLAGEAGRPAGPSSNSYRSSPATASRPACWWICSCSTVFGRSVKSI